MVGFSKRIVDWKMSHSSAILATNPALVTAIEEAFHTTEHDDHTIAQDLMSQGIATTHRQVRGFASKILKVFLPTKRRQRLFPSLSLPNRVNVGATVESY